MPSSDSSVLGSLSTRLGVAVRTVVLAAVLLLPVAIVSGWMEKMGGAPRPAHLVTPALEKAVAYVRALPARADVLALAAQGTAEGSWRFVNRTGEMLTVTTPDEMKRIGPVLFPDARAGARLALYMTQDTVLRDRAALKSLPPGIDLSVVVDGEGYRLLRRTDAAGERFFAEVRPNLVVEMGDRRLFEEAIWQLARRLDKARVRVLALEPGGPSTLPPSPRIDPVSKRPLVDAIDPATLAPAMRTVAGQTLVVLGRMERDVLYVKPSSGPERGLASKELFRAAADADVSMVVLLAASTPRQPGGLNWLWQRVEVAGLDNALQAPRLADFLNALSGPGRRLAAVALPLGERTVLDLTPAADPPGAAPPRPVGEVFSNIVSDLTGRVTTTAVQANLRSAERQREIDRRLLPGIPTEAQVGYGLLLVLGLLGVPVSRAWWQRVWPPERAGDYAGLTGYWAARSVRGLSFALVFVPLTAPVSTPLSLGRQLREAATAPWRLWRRLTAGAPAAPARRQPPSTPAEDAPDPVADAPAPQADIGTAAPGTPPRPAPPPLPRGRRDDRPRFLTSR